MSLNLKLTIILSISYFSGFSQSEINNIYDFGYIQAIGQALIEINKTVFVAGMAVPQGSVERNIHISSFDLEGTFINSIIWDNVPFDSELNSLGTNNDISLYNDSLILSYSSIYYPDCIIAVDQQLTGVSLKTCYEIDEPDNTLGVNSQVIFPNNTLVTISVSTKYQLILTEINLLNNSVSIRDLGFQEDHLYIPTKLIVDKNKNELHVLGYSLKLGPNSTIPDAVFGLFNVTLDTALNVINEYYYQDTISGIDLGFDAIFDSEGNYIITATEFDRVALEEDRYNLIQRPLILKFDPEFNLIWKRSIGSYFKPIYDFYNAIVASHDQDGYLFAGYQKVNPNLSGEDIGIIGKIGTHGDSVWFYQVYDLFDDNDNWLVDLITTSDGYYMACGTRGVKTQIDTINSRVQTWLIKFDEDGNLVTTTSNSNQEFDLDQKIKIYPNPSTGLIYIHHDDPGKTIYRTVNMSGQVINQKEHSGMNKILLFDTSDYPNGLYTIQALNTKGEVIYQEKVIVE